MEPKDYIYAVGILATAGLGIWNFFQSHRATRRASFINTVTSQRIKWLEQLRQDVSTFVGLTHSWSRIPDEDEPEKADFLKEIDKLRYLIRLRLNPDDEPDKKISQLVKKIPDLTHESKRDQLYDALEQLTAATQEMLKAEWEKVKSESENGNIKSSK